MTNEQLILKREILFKEEEKHQLLFIGAIKDLSKAIHQTLFLYKDSIVDKTKLLLCFYGEVVKFQNFIESQKKSNQKLRHNVHHASKSYLERKKIHNKALLDKELRCERLTISWFYPADIFDDFYNRFCKSNYSFITPSSVNIFFQEQIDKLYPIYMDKYITYLKNNRSSFWEITCLYLKEIVNIVARNAIFDLKQTEQVDLIKDSAWSDTYEILHSKIQNDDKLNFNTGTDFRNYIISIANYRVQNQRMKYVVKEDSLETLPYSVQEMEDETKDEISTCPIEDIDVQNTYEVAYAISIILLDSSHPLYQPLTKGIEDKIDILLRKVVNGQSYNAIVEEKWDIHPDSENFSKVVVETRKEFERVRKTLQERFITIKNRHQ